MFSRTKTASILLCGGSHNGRYYHEKGGVLREGDGLQMRDGDHYEIVRWPTGELVGVSDTSDLEQDALDYDDHEITVTEHAVDLAHLAFAVSTALSKHAIKQSIQVPLRIARSVLPL